MTPFELLEPGSLREALSLIDPDDETVRPLAGGTALMLMMKAGVFTPRRLVSLQKIESDYAAIAPTPAGGLRIGAMATLAALERAPLLAAYPVLRQTLRRLANVRVRNVACVGGALAHGDPHMDLPPVMAALGASVEIVGRTAARTVAVEDLYTGYYETVLARGELITALDVPPLAGRKAAYAKVTARAADDWPALGLAVSFALDGDRLTAVRLVAGAATAHIVRLRSAEAVLEGAPCEEAVLRRAGEAAAAEAPVIGDLRGSAAYKRELLRVYVGRTLRHALTGAALH